MQLEKTFTSEFFKHETILLLINNAHEKYNYTEANSWPLACMKHMRNNLLTHLNDNILNQMPFGLRLPRISIFGTVF